MFIAVDLGTTYIKLSTGDIFPSGISENICLSSNVLTVNNKQYAMELQNANAFDININKGLNKNTKLNFIYALAKSTNEEYTIFNDVFSSLPCSQWKNSTTVEKYKSYLSIPEPLEVDINGFKKTIQTEEISIIPEDASAYYTPDMDNQRFEGRKVLLCGFGSLTFNSILFENDEIIDLHTDEIGILKIYKDMAEAINSSTGENIEYTDMYNIIQNGLYINGILVDIEPIIKPVALYHCNNIYRNLKLKWSISSIPFVPIIGGGAITMYKYLKAFIPHLEITATPQTLAVIGMGMIAGVRL
jgi:hypothetical protein